MLAYPPLLSSLLLSIVINIQGVNSSVCEKCKRQDLKGFQGLQECIEINGWPGMFHFEHRSR